jgi:uncharacterized protein YciI
MAASPICSNKFHNGAKHAMKRAIHRLVFAALLASVSLAFGQGQSAQPEAHQKTTYLVVYKPGPGWIVGKPLSEQPLKEHGQYMMSLYIKGTMKFAGPFLDDTGGALVFEAENNDDARAIVAADPAVRSGIFVTEMHPWRFVNWEQYVKKPGSSTK